MSILVIGGHDRMHDAYKSIGSKYGHSLKVFTQMTSRFDKVIGKPDGIVLLTNMASHNMILATVREAKRKNIPVVRCHNNSVVSLGNSIKMLESAIF